ncbi:MAG: hypothetical protein HG446_004555 [Flavobacteriaceae bacterium]|nr:hypothetical protein [Flavobacteriaceae bacterium]
MNSTKTISFLDIENGDFFLINGVVISSKTTFSSLRELFPDNDIWDVGTGFYWIYFEKCPFEGKEFDISICFEGEKLETIFFSMKERYTPWKNWTEEYELQTEKLYKKWLTAHIGEKWEFVWGKAGASFDRKGGRTAMWISYI